MGRRGGVVGRDGGEGKGDEVVARGGMGWIAHST